MGRLRLGRMKNDILVKRYDVCAIDKSGDRFIQFGGFVLCDVDQNIGDAAKLVEAFDVGCRSSDLREFPIECLFHTVTSFLVSDERFEWLDQAIRRHDQLYALVFGKADDFQTAGVLLLKEGNFQYEVGLYVDVHARA